jgi:hypothetical protein
MPEDELTFVTMMVMVFLFGLGFFFTGTHLWGSFMAGMCLARSHYYHHVWVKQTKRMTSWMIRIFFACTVAFAIPVAKLLSIDAFWKGSIMGIFACILPKVGAAFWRTDKYCGGVGDNLVIGWAMVGRAEFAYLIAQLANSSNMLSPDTFSVVIWSLLYATVFAPFCFRQLLRRYLDRKKALHGGGGQPDEHPDEEIRMSGHLPIVAKPANTEYDAIHSKEYRPTQASELQASTEPTHAEKKPTQTNFVQSDIEEDHHAQLETHAKAALSANVHSNSTPAVDHGFDNFTKDSAQLDAQGGRGSGFLCCLFFRKIIIM